MSAGWKESLGWTWHWESSGHGRRWKSGLEVRAGETPKDVMWTEKGTAPGGLGAGPAKWGPGAGGGPALSEWGGGRRARAGGCQLRGTRRPPDLSAGSQAP